jgi:catalase
MTEEQANSQDYYMNPFDVTVWPHADYPLIDGSFRTESEPHYFQDIEQGHRARTYRGRIGYSPDMLCPNVVLMHNAIVWGRITNRFR